MSLLGRTIDAFMRPQGDGQGLFMRGTHAGKTVTVGTAMQLVPVYSAIAQIAGAVGICPLITYKRGSEYNERAPQHRAWRLLHTKPNEEQPADEFWELVDSHVESWGNAFIWKKRDALGVVQELWVIHPRRVQVTRDNQGKRLFSVDGEPFDASTILHIRNLSPDGLVGYSPIQQHRNALANDMSQEEFVGKFLRSDGRPAILLKHPNEMSEAAAKRLKASFEAVKAGGTAVLEEGVTVEKWQLPLADAQYIEQREFSLKEIALMFLLPPGRLGASSGDTMKYSSVEMDGLNFLTYTLQRRLRRIEGAVNCDPSIFVNEKFFCEFLTDGLMRSDGRARAYRYGQGLKDGYYTKDEVRRWENLPPLETEPASEEAPAEPDSKDPPEGGDDE